MAVDALGSATSALGSVTCPRVVLPKGSIQVATFKHLEVVREETHLGLGSNTESEEGIRDALTSPNTQACIQGTRAITTTIEVIDVPFSPNTLSLALLLP